MRVIFERREELAPGIWQHFFQPEQPVRFEPGQYVDLRLADVPDDPRGSGRTLTLTSLPDAPLISFVTKDQLIVSDYKQALGQLLPGAKATITDPMGDLVLPKDASIPLIFIAGGIGLCSFVSMLWLLQIRDERRQIQLYYSLSSAQESIFGGLLETFPFASKRVCVAPDRLSVAEMLAQAAAESLWYISGSQTFVETMQRDLETSGINRQSIIFDYYDGYVDL